MICLCTSVVVVISMEEVKIYPEYVENCPEKHAEMSANKKRKMEISKDLKRDPDDPRYTFIIPEKMKSDVWRNFSMVQYGGKMENYARCNSCKDIVSYVARNGTGSLLRHKCSPLASSKRATDKAARKAREDIAKQQLRIIMKDLVPMDTTDGEAFKKYCQSLINLGADSGKVAVDDILLPRITSSVMHSEYAKIKVRLRCILNNYPLAFSTDVWTDEQSQRTYISLKAHFINEKFRLKCFNLGTRECSFQHENSNNLQDVAQRILGEYKIHDKLDSSVIVTNNEVNVVAAFSNYERLSCACHSLNQVVEDALEKSNNTELELMLRSARKLVHHIRRTDELNTKLKTQFKHHQRERWHTLLIDLSSIFDIFADIQLILFARNELNFLTHIEENLLKSVLEFLKPFQLCSAKLSSEEMPSILEYSLWYEKLIKHCLLQPTDTEAIVHLKTSTESALKARFQPTMLHNVALFLNPSFKQLSCLSDEQREQVLDTVRSMLGEIRSRTLSDVQVKQDDSSGLDEMPDDVPTADPFEEFRDVYVKEEGDAEVDEIELELQTYQRKNAYNFTALEFWRNATRMPLLRQLAKQVLQVPASAAVAERLFSQIDCKLAERRHAYLDDNYDHVFFLHKNM